MYSGVKEGLPAASRNRLLPAGWVILPGIVAFREKLKLVNAQLFFTLPILFWFFKPKIALKFFSGKEFRWLPRLFKRRFGEETLLRKKPEARGRGSFLPFGLFLFFLCIANGVSLGHFHGVFFL